MIATLDQAAPKGATRKGGDCSKCGGHNAGGPGAYAPGPHSDRLSALEGSLAELAVWGFAITSERDLLGAHRRALAVFEQEPKPSSSHKFEAC